MDVTGDPDWGAIQANAANPVYSEVVDLGSSVNRTFGITVDKYATGSGGSVTYIRGSASEFARLDGSPSWTQYTGPTIQTWRYVQVRIGGGA